MQCREAVAYLSGLHGHQSVSLLNPNAGSGVLQMCGDNSKPHLCSRFHAQDMRNLEVSSLVAGWASC